MLLSNVEFNYVDHVFMWTSLNVPRWCRDLLWFAITSPYRHDQAVVVCGIHQVALDGIFCVSTRTFVLINNFSKLPATRIQPLTLAGNALARVQRVHETVDLLTPPFGPADFEAFSNIDTRRFWGPELSSIEETAPADPNP